MDNKTIVVTVFILVYTYLILFKSYRSIAIWCGIGALLATNVINFARIPSAINWNILGIFAGTLIIAEFFTLSRVPARLSDILIGRSKTVGSAMLRVCLLSGLISMFIENVAVVLIIAPIAFQVVKKLKISPVSLLIGIAIMSNLQGTATLIGDPPSMILAGQLKMNFNDFIFYHSRPGIFFAVQLSFIIGALVLFYIFKVLKEPVPEITQEHITSWVPTILLCCAIIGLALAPIFDPNFRWLSGTICVFFALITILWSLIHNSNDSITVIKQYDWDTTLFLAGVFVLISSFESVGLIGDLKTIILRYLGSNITLNFAFIVSFSVIVSAFLDNVPYIMLMIPVTHQMGIDIGAEYLLTFGLLVGTCFGGNITPVGASANIVAVGLLKKEGYPISFWTFVKIGLPFTIAATIGGAVFIWLIWH